MELFLKWSTIPGHRVYSKLWQIYPLEKIGVLGQRWVFISISFSLCSHFIWFAIVQVLCLLSLSCELLCGSVSSCLKDTILSHSPALALGMFLLLLHGHLSLNEMAFWKEICHCGGKL